MKQLITLLSLGVLAAAALAAPGRGVSGTWMVTSNGKQNPNMKLILTPQGQFKFAGVNYSSAGTYKVEGDTIKLTWTKVDGQPVKPGTIKKNLKLTPTNTFKIDHYTYTRR